MPQHPSKEAFTNYLLQREKKKKKKDNKKGFNIKTQLIQRLNNAGQEKNLLEKLFLRVYK